MRIDSGILGAKYIPQVLCDMGKAEIAYKIINHTDFPGWGHWISKGATTLHGNWDSSASLNHHMYSDISRWFYNNLAGINLDNENPGYKNIIFKPRLIGNLTYVSAWHKSMYGKIGCNWKLCDDMLSLNISVPANCTAIVFLPAHDLKNITESNNSFDKLVDIEFLEFKNNIAKFRIGSGIYKFISLI